MICNKCGYNNKNEAVYCVNCGEKIEAKSQKPEGYEPNNQYQYAQAENECHNNEGFSQNYEGYGEQSQQSQQGQNYNYQQGQNYNYQQGQQNQDYNYQQGQNYNYQQDGYYQPTVSPKNKVAAGLFAIFLGAFGIHKFYLGYNQAGVIMLLITIFGGIFTLGAASGVIGIIALIEGILYLTKSDQEFEYTYVYNEKPWF